MMMRIRTIMADTKVSPTSTIVPGFWATAAVASPKASKERVGCIWSYSEGKVLRERIEKKIDFGVPLRETEDRWTLKGKECGEGESDVEEAVRKWPLLYQVPLRNHHPAPVSLFRASLSIPATPSLVHRMCLSYHPGDCLSAPEVERLEDEHHAQPRLYLPSERINEGALFGIQPAPGRPRVGIDQLLLETAQADHRLHTSI